MLKTEMEQEQWTTIIEPSGGGFLQELRELWQYRQLIWMFVKRDFKTMYAQTILGPLWFVLNAVLSSSVMTVVFGMIAGISTNGIPGFLFYMSGNILWNNFSGCMSSVSHTFTGNARLMGKVWFPRMCVPISTILSRQIRFGIEAVIFLLVYGWYGFCGIETINVWRVLLLPVLLIQTMALAMGCGILLASATVKYRDLTVLISFLLQIWMYATPVVYPVTQIPESFRPLFLLNPMTPVIESFRSIFFGGAIPAGYLAVSMGMTIFILVIGMLVFQRAQRSFLDTV